MKRCKWVNLDNPNYIEYHDNEWGVPSYDDRYLFEMLVLESFQAGLSWECILNKRESFKKAFDNFDFNMVAEYDGTKIEELAKNKNIVRNKRKIMATVKNAKIFIKVRKEYGTFSKYIWGFTNNKQIINNEFLIHSELSDKISLDLSNRGMTFVGTVIIYSYLQAIGIINDHEKECYKKNYPIG